MSSRLYQPPWDFLLSASKTSLQSFELSRLSNAANLRREIVALMDQWLADQSNATVARLLMEERDRSARAAEAAANGEKQPFEVATVSDNFFADRNVAKTTNGGKS
jgi:hypothetical protein